MRKIRLPGEVLGPLKRLAACAGQAPIDREERAAVVARCAFADWDTKGPARRLDLWLASRQGSVGDRDRRAAVAGLALGFVENAPAFELPLSVRQLYGPAFRALVRNLAADGDYDGDSFARDVRLVLGLSAPAGAQDVDLAWRQDAPDAAGRLRRTGATLVRLGLAGDATGLRAFGKANPLRPWLQIHTDSRRLEDFNAAGWDACYARVAELLAGHPEYAGMLGVSWFYDPVVAAISPRLAYLRDRPMTNGAVQVRLGAGAEDVERATRTSVTRRRLHEAGQYDPRCWAIYWPRPAMLAWAARDRTPSSALRSAA